MSSSGLPAVTLILGGARSGKSRHGETLIEASLGNGRATYVATAEAGDAEMAARIAAHRERRGPRWTTVEAPLDLPRAIAAAPGPVLIDCLTLWLSNLMAAGLDPEAEGATLLDALGDTNNSVVLVSNEVGLGIVPMNDLARAFRDAAGRLHQRVAAAADHVVFMAAGLPLDLKTPRTAA